MIDIEFDFEKGSMEGVFLFIKERINGVWESNTNRNAFTMQNGHFDEDLILTGDYIQVYFEKKNGSDDGILTTCFVDNFKASQNDLKIVEENNYYPFGMTHKGYNSVVYFRCLILNSKL